MCQDYGGEKSSDVGVDGFDVLLITHPTPCPTTRTHAAWAPALPYTPASKPCSGSSAQREVAIFEDSRKDLYDLCSNEGQKQTKSLPPNHVRRRTPHAARAPALPYTPESKPCFRMPARPHRTVAQPEVLDDLQKFLSIVWRDVRMLREKQKQVVKRRPLVQMLLNC